MHFSYIISDGKIISSGMNNNGIPHPKWGYHSSKLTVGFKPKTHSELNCIMRTKQYIRGATMINIRLTKSGEARLSMPCKTCRNVLKVVGIKRCLFTTEVGWGTLDIE